MSRLEAISREILSQARTTIVLNMRFMDMAVFRLKPVAAPVTLATDGEYLYYHPLWLLKRYRGEANAVMRDYLHVLLHCVFRHPFVSTLVDRRLWDLACDIAAEGLICELNQPLFATKSEVTRRAVADGLRQKVKPLTAEKPYHYFQTHAPDPAWEKLFRADDHEIWHSPAKAQQMSQQAQSQSQKEDGDGQGQSDSGSGDGNQKDKSPDDSSGDGQGRPDSDTRNQDGSGHGNGAGSSEQGGAVLTVTEKGYGKRTALDEYAVKGRGGIGVKNYNCTDKTGLIADVKIVTGDEDLLVITDDATIIRMAVDHISLLSRATQGVRIMRLSPDSRVISIERTEKNPAAESAEAENEVSEES